MKPRSWLHALRATEVLTPGPGRALRHLVGAMWHAGPNLFALAAWQADRHPDRVALVGDDTALTYRELVVECERAAHWLVSIGVQRRVGVAGKNPRNVVVLLLALQRLGIDVLMLNTLASPAERIASAQRAGVSMVVSDDPTLGTVVMPATLPARAVLGRPRRRVPSILLMTSGTTDLPTTVKRRVTMAAVDTACGLSLELGVKSGDRVSMSLPLFHGHGLATVALCVALGATLTLRARPRPDAEWADIAAGNTDILVTVPTLLRRLLADADVGHRDGHHGGRLRAVISGSAPLDEALVVATHDRLGPVLHNVYGTSECGAISHAGPDLLKRCWNTAGRPLPGVECVIRAPVDGIGELWVRGGMSGRRWRPTHDLASLTASPAGDVLTLHGRTDGVLVIGGENVRLEQVESRVAELSGVQDCAMRPVDDAEYGTRLELVAVLAPGESTDHLQQQLDAALPRSLRPVAITVVDRLPRTPLGKLKRREL